MDEVEQFDDEGTLSHDDDDELWAIRERSDVVERVARRVVSGVDDEELGET